MREIPRKYYGLGGHICNNRKLENQADFRVYAMASAILNLRKRRLNDYLEHEIKFTDRNKNRDHT